MSLLDHLQTKLDAIAAQDLTRFLRPAETVTAPRQTVRGADGVARELLMFCSNDYLGLAAHPRLADALAEGARAYGGGSGASHLISGHSVAHQRLEETLADWYAPHIPNARALGFCTGYMANLAVVTALGDAEAEIFSASLNHASLIDGARLARAQVTRYPHADLEALRAALAASRAKVKLIVTDAVFSMDGDLAPLPQILKLAEEFDAWMIVDDAHGFGVLGAKGRGSLEHFDLKSERIILVGTLGKAAGLSGAFVVAHETVTEYLLQAARPYIFTTASPPAIAHALITALDLIESELGQQRRNALVLLQFELRRSINALLARYPRLGWKLAASDTPIQPLIIGDNAAVMKLAARLEREGLRVPGIRPPTVPMGEARLRITLCATHTMGDIERLVRALSTVAAEMSAA
ncbi:8-amino-7-oxononanoate synthase [Paucibacter sp. R3-3]|uniref:8-amino-7-oxononanoate synthase n=1 Tax=Roseateles agri TaxID=3098619 RepID=A0ABU5DE77_9BURK|nr:8-amino-7-oxononanoate synthase [Paucibacter sp. R3-3]MDY0744060.1 8-amino-7-oxononanoate synthase [Paucibacter sp. R3-3]